MNSNEIVNAVTAGLERLGVPYMLVGSFSSNFYGTPRSTKDADLVLELGSRSLSDLIALLGPDFKLDPQMGFETVTSTTRYRMHYQPSPFMVEFFLLSNDLHDQQRFSRRRTAIMSQHSVTVAAPEDVIITKLRWSRAGKRQKDVDDVVNILAVQTAANLDLAYIRHWTDQHGTRELFEKLLKETEDFNTEK